MKENMKIVIVGHKDHGKSTLIGRLFYDTDSLSDKKMADIKHAAEKRDSDVEFAHMMDHLKEERDQGITIDTAQTFFSTEKRDYTIIDAPGHKEFIKNMVTGASQAEAAILIVDVEKGVEPQSKRHAYVLSMLGIDQIILAMNKVDLIDHGRERYEKVSEEMCDFLDELDIEPESVIPISAKMGDNVANGSENMNWYKGPTVLEALDSLETVSDPEDKPFRFPVQDVYDREEKVVVGRVESGTVTEGQNAYRLPGEKSIVVEEIKKYKEEVTEASAGESIGLILDDMEDVKRGHLISDHELPVTTDRIQANLFWLTPEVLTTQDEFVFRVETQETKGRLSKIEKRIDASSLETIAENADKLKEHEVGEVIIDLDEEVHVDDFNDIKETGRFVIERNGTIQGGGIIDIEK